MEHVLDLQAKFCDLMDTASTRPMEEAEGFISQAKQIAKKLRTTYRVQVAEMHGYFCFRKMD